MGNRWHPYTTGANQTFSQPNNAFQMAQYLAFCILGYQAAFLTTDQHCFNSSTPILSSGTSIFLAYR